MENRFDALAKALAGGVSRREALRRLGGGVAGILLGAAGLRKAWGEPAPNSQCEDFCRTTCGVQPGNGNAFGTCVSSCEACVNSNGSPPSGCPSTPGGPVVCTGGLCGGEPCDGQCCDCPCNEYCVETGADCTVACGLLCPAG